MVEIIGIVCSCHLVIILKVLSCLSMNLVLLYKLNRKHSGQFK